MAVRLAFSTWFAIRALLDLVHEQLLFLRLHEYVLSGDELFSLTLADFPRYHTAMVNRSGYPLAKLARKSACDENASAKTSFDGTNPPMVAETSQHHHIWYER
jgi:hypothetical protein